MSIQARRQFAGFAGIKGFSLFWNFPPVTLGGAEVFDLERFA